MRNKVNEIVTKAKIKAAQVLVKKDQGMETLMVIALVCVIAVSLTAMFRTEAGTLLDSIFDTMSGFMSSAGDMYYYGDAYSYIGDSFSGVLNAAAMRNPVYTMGTVIMVIGIVIMIAGVVLAIFLKQKSKK